MQVNDVTCLYTVDSLSILLHGGFQAETVFSEQYLLSIGLVIRFSYLTYSLQNILPSHQPNANNKSPKWTACVSLKLIGILW